MRTAFPILRGGDGCKFLVRSRRCRPSSTCRDRTRSPSRCPGRRSSRARRRIHRSRRRRSGERRASTSRWTSTIQHLLAQDGLAPVGVESAVPPADGLRGRDDDHRTLRARARPRRALWADVAIATGRRQLREQFVRRLRIYPHALRDRNAYYSPAKKALLFGYFPVDHARTRTTRRARWSSPACRTTSSRTRRRTRCSTACTRASTSRRNPRRAGLPRSVRRHRRAVPALHVSRRCCESQIARTRGDLDSEKPARPAGAAVRARHRPRRRAARRARRHRRRHRRVEAAPARSARARRDRRSRTPAAPSSWRRFSRLPR